VSGPPSSRLQRVVAPIAAGSVALVAAALTLIAIAPDAAASETLQNPGFDEWSGSAPAAWNVTTGSVEPSADIAVSGTSLHVTAPGSVQVVQNVPAAPGAAFHGSVYVASDHGVATATLSVNFLDADFIPIDPGIRTTTVLVTSTSFVPVSVSGTAPPGTDSVTFTIALAGSPGPLSAYVDAASFDQGVAPPPTPTEQPTDAPTATPTSVPSSADGSPTIGTGTSPTATRTARPTATEKPGKTATPTKTPRPTGTPTPQKTATPTKTARATATRASTRTATPGTTETPEPVADSGAGGMLANGDFEQDAGGAPAAWSKFGGTMALSDDAYDGDHAATLTSNTTSTKWLYQAAPVDGGAWYTANVVARVVGDGEVSLRLSWYASGDGSGSAIDDIDGDATTSSEWTELSTGAVQAPASASSVRVRLMLRPTSSAGVTATFDNASLFATDAPPATPTPVPGGDVAGTATAGVPTAGVEGNGSAGDAPTARSTAASGRTTTTPKATAVKAARTSPAEATAPAGGNLRFSEVMSAPDDSAPDQTLQWVELVNPGGSAVSTEGWSIANTNGANELTAARIPAGGYGVIMTNPGSLPGVLGIAFAEGDAHGGLGRTGDELHLFSPDGTEVDAISYGDNASIFDPAPIAPEPGETIGLLDPQADHDGADWVRTDHPTPGKANSFAAIAPNEPAAAARSGAAARERSGEPSATVVWIALGTLVAAGLGGTAAYSQRRRLDSIAQKVRRGR